MDGVVAFVVCVGLYGGFKDSMDAYAHTYEHTITFMNAHTHPTPMSTSERQRRQIILKIDEVATRDDTGFWYEWSHTIPLLVPLELTHHSYPYSPTNRISPHT